MLKINFIKIARLFLFLLWIILLTWGLFNYISNPEAFSTGNIVEFFRKFNTHLLFAYTFISIIRGFTLIPVTPFVIAGSLLFIGQPFLVLFISIACMIISSTLIYYFSEFIGFDAFFQKKYPHKINEIREQLNSNKGFMFIVLWSFIPVAPTDLISYIAGTINMNFLKFITALFLGEFPICAIYVFTGKGIVNFLF